MAERWVVLESHLLGERRYGRRGTRRAAAGCVTTPQN